MLSDYNYPLSLCEQLFELLDLFALSCNDECHIGRKLYLRIGIDILLSFFNSSQDCCSRALANLQLGNGFIDAWKGRPYLAPFNDEFIKFHLDSIQCLRLIAHAADNRRKLSCFFILQCHLGNALLWIVIFEMVYFSSAIIMDNDDDFIPDAASI